MASKRSAPNYWDRVLPHYSARDWERCLRELRPALDADEDALAPRLLCAGLHLAAAQPVLALLQYESLLPLSVGQGEFFAAIAVQRRLDLLHPTSVTHPKRYEVLHRWFCSLGRNRRVLPGERPGELNEAALLKLEPEEFTQVLEHCVVEGLDPAPRALTEGLGACRIVLYGRVRWSLAGRDGAPLLEGTAEAGQTIAIDPGLASGASLTLTADLPAEMLVFGADALDPIRRDVPAEPRPQAPAPGRSRTPRPRRAASAGRERANPPPRPQPDPRFEPVFASGAPHERRRESRVTISLASGAARLGLADTRVGPLKGRTTSVSAEHLQLVFPRSDLRHLRSRLEGSCLAIQFNLGPDQPAIVCTGRVRWTTALATGRETGELHLEVEILPLPAAERAQLEEAGRRFSALGPARPPGPGERAA